jgi:hypothetical protein
MTRRPTRCLALLVSLLLMPPAFAALELSTDGRALSFGLMQLGEEKVLAQAGSHHNEVTVRSSSGRPWYLKISLLRPLSSGTAEIPLDDLAWELARTDGSGNAAQRSRFQPFSLTPELVYLSGAGEADGRSISLQFRYRLTIPEAQVRGVYSTTIRYTLTEIL